MEDTRVEEPAGSPRRSSGFMLSPWIVVAIILVCGTVLLAGLFSASGAEEVGRSIGAAFGVLLLTLLPAMIAYWVSGRSSKAVNATAILFLLLAGLAQLSLALKKESLDKASWERYLQTVVDIQREYVAALQKEVETGEVMDNRAKGLRKMSEGLRDAADRSAGKVGASLNAVADAYEVLTADLAGYERELDRFVEAGGIDTATLQSIKAIRSRLEMASGFEKANTNLHKTLKGMAEELATNLEEAGAPQSVIQDVVKGVRSNGQLMVVLKIRRLDAELADKMRNVLMLLRDRWGKWQYDQRKGQPVFASQEAVKRYNSLLTEVARLAKKQTQLQRELLERQRQESAPDSVEM